MATIDFVDGTLRPMDTLSKHVDLLAGLAALAWALLVLLVEAAQPLGEHVSPSAAMAFGMLALGRWYAGVRRVVT